MSVGESPFRGQHLHGESSKCIDQLEGAVVMLEIELGRPVSGFVLSDRAGSTI